MKNRMQYVFNKHEFPLNGTSRRWEEINVYLSLTDERESIYTWQTFNEKLPVIAKTKTVAERCGVVFIVFPLHENIQEISCTHSARERERWHPSFNFKRLIELRRFQSKLLSILLPHRISHNE